MTQTEVREGLIRLKLSFEFSLVMFVTYSFKVFDWGV
jgi:hypothetical protein